MNQKTIVAGNDNVTGCRQLLHIRNIQARQLRLVEWYSAVFEGGIMARIFMLVLYPTMIQEALQTTHIIFSTKSAN